MATEWRALGPPGAVGGSIHPVTEGVPRLECSGYQWRALSGLLLVGPLPGAVSGSIHPVTEGVLKVFNPSRFLVTYAYVHRLPEKTSTRIEFADLALRLRHANLSHNLQIYRETV